MSKTVLVRYGAISEVSRFVNASGTALCRGTHVVVQSHRGLECGLLLEDAPADDELSALVAAAYGLPAGQLTPLLSWQEG